MSEYLLWIYDRNVQKKMENWKDLWLWKALPNNFMEGKDKQEIEKRI